ncbi:MAG: hypothetical protein C0482_10435 [Gordonia sp.]|nr:hypothetical protein [Gordonia sp. (in: high G+C Gram-positive bacteria)]
MGSTTERSTIAVGDFSLYPGQLLAFVLAPLVIAGNMIKSSVFVRVAIFALVAACLLFPSVLFLPGQDARMKLIAQLAANCIVMLIVFGLLQALSYRQLQKLVTVLAVIISIGVAIQVVFFSSMLVNSGERFLGLPRPMLLFSEPTWLATFVALLFAAALSLRQRNVAIVLGLLLLAVFTRGALALALVALAVSVPALARLPWARAAVAAVPLAFGFWFFWSAVTGPEPRVQGSSLDSRAFDSWVVRLANDDNFMPWGGTTLSYQIPGVWRGTPETSNVVGFDLFWKFGIGGLVVFVLWWWLIAGSLPRILASVRPPDVRVWPAWITLMVLPATMQFNNSFGRPWVWAMIALLLAIIGRLSVSPDPEKIPTRSRPGGWSR